MDTNVDLASDEGVIESEDNLEEIADDDASLLNIDGDEQEIATRGMLDIEPAQDGNEDAAMSGGNACLDGYDIIVQDMMDIELASEECDQSYVLRKESAFGRHLDSPSPIMTSFDYSMSQALSHPDGWETQASAQPINTLASTVSPMQGESKLIGDSTQADETRGSALQSPSIGNGETGIPLPPVVAVGTASEPSLMQGESELIGDSAQAGSDREASVLLPPVVAVQEPEDKLAPARQESDLFDDTDQSSPPPAESIPIEDIWNSFEDIDWDDNAEAPSLSGSKRPASSDEIEFPDSVLTLNGKNYGVIFETPETLSVSEANLPNGTSPDASALTRKGSLIVSAIDGLAALLMSCGASSNAIPLTGESASITVGNGTFSASYTNGVINYEYVLIGSVAHTASQERYTIDITGKSTYGSSASKEIELLVEDDEPIAVADSAIMSAKNTSVTGNVLSNDKYGADGPATSGALVWASSAKYGTFSGSANGAWAYTLDNSNASVASLASGQTLNETISYSIKDGDGDIKDSNLTITIEGYDRGPQLKLIQQIHQHTPEGTPNLLNTGMNDVNYDSNATVFQSDIFKTATSIQFQVNKCFCGYEGSPSLWQDSYSSYSSFYGTFAHGDYPRHNSSYNNLVFGSTYNKISGTMGINAALHIGYKTTNYDTHPGQIKVTIRVINAGIDYRKQVELNVGISTSTMIKDLNIDLGQFFDITKILSVSEANLPNGTSPNYSALTRTGSLIVSAIDGLAALSMSCGASSIAIPLTGKSASITVGNGTFSASYANGVINYNYVLNGSVAHTVLQEKYVIDITSQNTYGNSTSKVIDLLVDDDEPIAIYDFATMSAKNTSVSGNVLSNDKYGADGAAASNALIWTSRAKYGTLSGSANGAWTYTLDKSNASVATLKSAQTLKDTINYSIKDGDGDVASSKLTITIEGYEQRLQLNRIQQIHQYQPYGSKKLYNSEYFSPSSWDSNVAVFQSDIFKTASSVAFQVTHCVCGYYNVFYWQNTYTYESGNYGIFNHGGGNHNTNDPSDTIEILFSSVYDKTAGTMGINAALISGRSEHIHIKTGVIEITIKAICDDVTYSINVNFDVGISTYDTTRTMNVDFGQWRFSKTSSNAVSLQADDFPVALNESDHIETLMDCANEEAKDSPADFNAAGKSDSKIGDQLAEQIENPINGDDIPPEPIAEDSGGIQENAFSEKSGDSDMDERSYPYLEDGEDELVFPENLESAIATNNDCTANVQEIELASILFKNAESYEESMWIGNVA